MTSHDEALRCPHVIFRAMDFKNLLITGGAGFVGSNLALLSGRPARIWA